MPRDEQRAVNLLEKAAILGHAGAQAQLGVRYLRGQGVTRDPDRAKSWLERAADQGNREAAKRLQATWGTNRGKS
jgi:TPR repeat protein